MTLSEAEMYFWTYDILMRTIESKGSQEEIKIGDDEQKEVDVRCFAIFMAS